MLQRRTRIILRISHIVVRLHTLITMLCMLIKRLNTSLLLWDTNLKEKLIVWATFWPIVYFLRTWGYYWYYPHTWGIFYNNLLVFHKPQKNVLHALFFEFMDFPHDTNHGDNFLLMHVNQQQSFLKCVGIIVTSMVR